LHHLTTPPIYTHSLHDALPIFFTAIAAFILLIACINFMNLSTARSERCAKEVGVRKVVGGRRYALIGQFLTESILLASLAGALSDRKSTRLNSSHVKISYAVFC